MRESIFKTIANLVALAIFIKLIIFINESKSVWESSDPLNFSEFGKIEDINCKVFDVIYLNNKLSNTLDILRKTLFFKIFKINLEGECTHFTQNMICNYPTCAVCQCEDSEIPLPWKQESSQKEKIDYKIEDKFKKWTSKFNTSTIEWLQEEEINSEDGLYVNLLKNPEAYTGYQGQHIWNAIFRENCFSDSLDKICAEERIFYRILSGLLTNINVQLSVNYQDPGKNKSYMNLTMFRERVFNHPDRVDNLFFLYSLLIKAFNKAEYIIRNFEINTGNFTEDIKTRKIIDDIYQMKQFRAIVTSCNDVEDNLKKFLSFNNMNMLISRFRNISSIMDCVSCQKCKLHGKLQIFGLATMLKILMDKNYSNSNGKSIDLKLTRNELIAFVNLVAKISKSINYFYAFDNKIKYHNWSQNVKYIFLFVVYIFGFVYFNFFFNKQKQTRTPIYKNFKKMRKYKYKNK